jgi:hypothetical protein
MLSASVLGAVFTSPDTDSIVAAIKAVAGKRGALLVVKNYTGDRLNFGLAAEIARSEGIPVEMIVVHDDVALNGSGSITGPRGLAGTVFIHKIVGAAAAEGMPLAEVAAIGRGAIDSLATMGVPTTPVGSALSTNSRPAIATARHFDDPESPINVLGARHQNPNSYVSSVKRKSLSSIRCVAITTRRRTAVAICHRGNSHMPITIVTTSDTLVHGSAQTLDNGDACEMALQFLMVNSVWKADC